MTGDLVERLRESMQRGYDWAMRKEGSDGSGLMVQLSDRLGEAAREIERRRASPPVNELIEALAPFAALHLPVDHRCFIELFVCPPGDHAENDWRPKIERARELHDRLKGEEER